MSLRKSNSGSPDSTGNNFNRFVKTIKGKNPSDLLQIVTSSIHKLNAYQQEKMLALIPRKKHPNT